MEKSLKKFRVAIIGCGRISVMHLVSIDMCENTELVACCDIKKDRADAVAEKYGVKAYYSYEEIFIFSDYGIKPFRIFILLINLLRCEGKSNL